MSTPHKTYLVPFDACSPASDWPFARSHKRNTATAHTCTNGKIQIPYTKHMHTQYLEKPRGLAPRDKVRDAPRLSTSAHASCAKTRNARKRWPRDEAVLASKGERRRYVAPDSSCERNDLCPAASHLLRTPASTRANGNASALVPPGAGALLTLTGAGDCTRACFLYRCSEFAQQCLCSPPFPGRPTSGQHGEQQAGRGLGLGPLVKVAHSADRLAHRFGVGRRQDRTHRMRHRFSAPGHAIDGHARSRHQRRRRPA